MNLIKKVLVSAFSDVVITIVGFFGTIYFARVLGAGPIGTFALGLTVVQIFLLMDLGVGHAAMKRISADRDPNAHFTAALLIYGSTLVGAIGTILVFSDRVNAYVGGEFALLVVVILAFQRLYQMLNLGIKGRKRVHVRDSIDAVEQIARVGGQAILVYAGFRTLALFLGYATSFGLAVLLAFAYHLRYLSLSMTMPSREHFNSLYRFSRYSWVGNFKSRAFSWTDVAIMGLFLSNSAIGVYQIAWTLAMSFQILGQSLGRNLFPEISEADSGQESTDRVGLLAEKSLLFAGLLPLPGIVGAILLGDRVLAIYGEAFTSGGAVLTVLVVVSLLRAFEGSVYALANGIDEPRITFVSSLLFVAANVALNLVLIYYLGALGAAIATVTALALSLALAYRMVRRRIDFAVPTEELGIQMGAAVLMGVLVWGLKALLVPLSFAELLAIIATGASMYFAVVLTLSRQVRSTVLRVVPGLN